LKRNHQITRGSVSRLVKWNTQKIASAYGRNIAHNGSLVRRSRMIIVARIHVTAVAKDMHCFCG